VDFRLTAEQQQLREVARRFLAARTGSWPELVELGWFDADTGLVERAVVAEELGHALSPLPWPAALALPASLAPLAADAPLAWAEGDAATALTAGGWTVSGTVTATAGGTGAAGRVLVASADGLFAFDAAAPGCVHRDRGGIDPARAADEWTLRDAPATPLLAGAAAAEAIAAEPLRRRTLLAAEAVGVARRAFETAADHARTREQFGRPIGSYQGIAFPIADVYTRIELARSLVLRAAWLVQDEDELAGRAVLTALPAARRAALGATEQAIQTLGGLGMTWEHPAHRWYRRAMWFEGHDVPDRACFDALAVDLLSAPPRSPGGGSAAGAGVGPVPAATAKSPAG